MDQPSTTPAPESGCLSQIGLAALVIFATLAALSLTMLVPPWVKAKCQRQGVLYYSQQVKVYERTFVGFDFLFAGRKWQRIGPTTAVGSGQTFDVTEYQILWPVLVGEWIVIMAVAGYVFVVRSRRLRVGLPPLASWLRINAPTALSLLLHPCRLMLRYRTTFRVTVWIAGEPAGSSRSFFCRHASGGS